MNTDDEQQLSLEIEAEPEEITKPFDPSQIRVKSKSIIIDTLLKRIRHNELELTPGFQRKAGLWTDETQSQLIESLLIRIPLPAFYLDATDDNQWVVIDGLQRLTTLKRFMIDKTLKLVGLEFLDQMEGKNYDTIGRNYIRRIEETEVVVSLIEEGTPPDVKFNIFKRINTGGMPLSAQEIRHALYYKEGDATHFLEKLANSKVFKQATDWRIPNKRMEDREFVLRFVAFLSTDYSKLDQGINRFLNYTMEMLNQKTEKELNEISKKFEQAMETAYQIFDNDAFRKRYNKTAGRNPINKGLFDVLSVNFANLKEREKNILVQKKEEFKKQFIELMNDNVFYSALVGNTSHISKVEVRYEMLRNLIDELL